MEQKKIMKLHFEAGELLRREIEEMAASLANVLKNAKPEDFATVARDVLGSGELAFPYRLIQRLRQCHAYRLTREAQIKRIQKYVAERLQII